MISRAFSTIRPKPCLHDLRSRACGFIACALAICDSATAIPNAIQESAAAPQEAGSIHVISIDGTLGKLSTAPTERIITSADIAEEIDSSLQSGASAIVLEINGPGGTIREMQSAVEMLFTAQEVDSVRLVALPKKAHGTWSIACLSCAEMICYSTSLLGTSEDENGRVHGFDDENNPRAMQDAAWGARQRAVSEITGTPTCVQDAITEPSKQLWWSPRRGFAATRGQEADWKRLDQERERSALCLNAIELVETGLARGKIRELSDLPKILDLPQAKVVTRKLVPIQRREERRAAKEADITDVRNKLTLILKKMSQTDKTFQSKEKPVRGLEAVGHGGVIGGVAPRPIITYRDETVGERIDRIESYIQSLSNQYPAEFPAGLHATLLEGLQNGRRQLDEAKACLRKKDITGARTQVEALRRNLENLVRMP